MSGQQHHNTTLAVFAAEVVKTREFRIFLDSVLTNVLDRWGGQGDLKPELARHARRIISRRLARAGEGAAHRDLDSLLQDPEVMEYARARMPGVINGIVDAAAGMAASLEDASKERQQAFFNDLFAALDSHKIGVILSSLARTVDSLHKSDPTMFADRTVQIMGRVLANIDFGDLKAIFENADSDIKALGTRVNDLLFEYPAKLILILSFVPGISNHLLFFLTDLVKRFNDLPADILTDLLISFFREVDGVTAGKLLNNLAEMIRQMHTGSALIGDAGTPQFSIELARKAEAVLDGADTELLFKAGKALVEGKEALVKALYDAAGDDPAFPGLALKHRVLEKNSSARMAKRRMEFLEDLSGKEAAAAMAAGLSEWNAYEFAELINSACSTVNRLHQYAPDVLKHVVTDFINSLDIQEIEDSAAWISRDLTETLKPVLQAVVPVLVRDVVGCLAADNGENGEQVAEMREILRQFILNKDEP